jgi:hypothetical protein
MTFDQYRSIVSRPYEEARATAAQKRLVFCTWVVAVVVGLAGAVAVGALLSGCGGRVAEIGYGTNCRIPDGGEPIGCERVSAAEVCCATVLEAEQVKEWDAGWAE